MTAGLRQLIRELAAAAISLGRVSRRGRRGAAAEQISRSYTHSFGRCNGWSFPDDEHAFVGRHATRYRASLAPVS